MREARGDLVLALDDDSYPEQLDCIARIVPFFEQRPKLAVLHFPQRTDEYPETLAQTDFGSEHLTRSFANSGAVLRRSTYLQLPGFESRFFHMYEEPDYALQCVAAGYDVLFSPVITIRHHYSGQARDEIRIHHRHARNEFWSTLMRCPFPFAVGIVAWRVFSQFRYACKRGWYWVVREPVWWGRRWLEFHIVFESAGLFHGEVINAGSRCHKLSSSSRCHVRHGGFVPWRIEPFDFAQDRLRETSWLFRCAGAVEIASEILLPRLRDQNDS